MYTSETHIRVTCFVSFYFLTDTRTCSVQPLFEPRHEKTCSYHMRIKKGTDQPARPRSLISAFVVRFLDSIISIDAISEISRL